MTQRNPCYAGTDEHRRAVALLTPKERALRAKAAAHALHSQCDSKELTAKARETFLSKFEREVDPEGTLSPDERKRRAEHARKAYFARLALKSAKSRREKAERQASKDHKCYRAKDGIKEAQDEKIVPPAKEAAPEWEV